MIVYLTKKIKSVFDFIVPLAETIQENVEIMTKTNEFPKLEYKKEIRKKRKQLTKKKLLQDLVVNDMHMARINSNIKSK